MLYTTLCLSLCLKQHEVQYVASQKDVTHWSGGCFNGKNVATSLAPFNLEKLVELEDATFAAEITLI